MEYKLATADGKAETALTGRFTFADHAAFRAMANDAVATGATRWTMDLSGLSFIDSAALGMLLLCRERAVANDISLVLRGANEQVKKIMTLAKFDKLFVVED